MPRDRTVRQLALFDRDLYRREIKRHMATWPARSWRYLCWLARSDSRRARLAEETLYSQRGLCGACGLVLAWNRAHMHHLDYTHVNGEAPSDIIAVHPICHAKMHNRPDLYYPNAA